MARFLVHSDDSARVAEIKQYDDGDWYAYCLNEDRAIEMRPGSADDALNAAEIHVEHQCEGGS